ncbi:MAG: cell envelope integrity EipB family protein [Magnetospirillum sp.]|nr:cell envelope integrity EipB family protein [Magnetospirillum sp.]
MKRSRGVVLAGMVAGLATLATTAAPLAAELVSHRATYRMGLSASRSGSGMANANGAWTYQFADACDGWVTEFRLAITYSYSEGGQVATTTDFLGWESKDGLVYRFRVRQSREGQVTEEVEGIARLNGIGQGGVAHYTRPEAHTIKLPKGTLFPTAHTLRLIETANKGGRIMARPLFDGQGDEGPFDTSAQIGRVVTPQPASAGSPLLNSPAWPMRMAFFPLGSTDPLPEFEMSLSYHANGVAEDIEQIFKTFSLRGKLESIEMLPRTKC